MAIFIFFSPKDTANTCFFLSITFSKLEYIIKQFIFRYIPFCPSLKIHLFSQLCGAQNVVVSKTVCPTVLTEEDKCKVTIKDTGIIYKQIKSVWYQYNKIY